MWKDLLRIKPKGKNKGKGIPRKKKAVTIDPNTQKYKSSNKWAQHTLLRVIKFELFCFQFFHDERVWSMVGSFFWVNLGTKQNFRFLTLACPCCILRTFWSLAIFCAKTFFDFCVQKFSVPHLPLFSNYTMPLQGFTMEFWTRQLKTGTDDTLFDTRLTDEQVSQNRSFTQLCKAAFVDLRVEHSRLIQVVLGKEFWMMIKLTFRLALISMWMPHFAVGKGGLVILGQRMPPCSISCLWIFPALHCRSVIAINCNRQSCGMFCKHWSLEQMRTRLHAHFVAHFCYRAGHSCPMVWQDSHSPCQWWHPLR